ncbi:MAG: cation:proton antiporter [Nanoarchaeota archaeon]|nr:cation:proton antiporter [Nanoarchaeota archaeon]
MQFPTELGIIILLSMLSGVLAVRFNKPYVLGLIIVGAIAGNTGLVQNRDILSIVTEVGAILLMFTVGIEFNLDKLFRFGLPALAVGLLKIGGTFVVGYLVSHLLGFSNIASIFMGAILSITSTVIFLKVLEQKGMAKREEIPFLVAILIIEDIFGIFLLNFFTGLNQSQDIQNMSIITNLAVSFLLLFLAYSVILRFVRPVVSWMLKYSAEETVTFLSISICSLFVYISFLLKLSPTVGAFLAGNIVASLPQAKLFEKAIHPFLLTFTSLFFFSMGTSVKFAGIASNAFPIMVFFLIIVSTHMLLLMLGTYLFGNFSARSALFSGISMVSVGEFSLLIANQSKNLQVGVDLVTITASLILLSTIFMSFILDYESRMLRFFSEAFPWKNAFRKIQVYLHCLSFKFSSDKIHKDLVLKEARSLAYYLSGFILLISTGFLIWRFFIIAFHPNVNLVYFSVLGILSLVLTLIALKHARDILHDFDVYFLEILPGDIENRSSLSSLVIVLLLFSLMIFFPLLSMVLEISFSHIIVLVLVMLFALFLFRLLSNILTISNKCASDYNKLNREILKAERTKEK